MSIIVKTQLGTGGAWSKEGEWATGPRNLLKAVKTAHEEIRTNRGVGGYRTLIEIDGAVLSHIHDGWPSTMDEARAAIQKKAAMTPDQFAALSALMGLRTGPAREAARMVLVEGLTKAEAARRAGCAPQSADQAVKRCQRAIKLAQEATQ